MTLITFLPHTPFKKKNVLSFLICIVISMGKVEKVNVLYKNAIYEQTNDDPYFFFLLLAVFYGACSSQQEKTPQTDTEHGQTGQKLKY